MKPYVSKAGVYHNVQQMRCALGITWEDYPLNVRAHCAALGVVVEEIPLKTSGLRGVAVPAQTRGEPDIILINVTRSASEHNFDCGHEWYHLCQHRHLRPAFNCLERGTPAQDRAIEWQANEGAAELTVPLALLLPRIVDAYSYLTDSWEAIRDFKTEQAAWFDVSPGVFKFRLESLRYEIQQAIHGRPLSDLVLCSATRQHQTGVRVESLNEMELRLYQNRSHVFPVSPIPHHTQAVSEDVRLRNQVRADTLHRAWLNPESERVSFV